jgi:glycosyltransferase involved in cell wall biosynthesis
VDAGKGALAPPSLEDSLSMTSATIAVLNYNYGRFLDEAIKSALAQTVPTPVLVIDDGSTDGSDRILARYADRVTVLVQPNAGLVATRNRALNHVETDFIVFLDADNHLSPRYVELTVAAYQHEAQSHDVALVYGDRLDFGTRHGRNSPGNWDRTRLANHNYIDNNALLHRIHVLTVGGYSPEMHGIGCEDWDLWLTLCEHGFRGIYEPQATFGYRVHGEAMTAAALRDLKPIQAAIARKHPWCDRERRGGLLTRVGRKVGHLSRRRG